MFPVAIALAALPADAPLFEASPAELRSLAEVGTAEVEVLLDEYGWSMDDGGRWTHTWRRRFVVRSQQSAQGMAMLQTDWIPERQDRPTVKARVVDASGRLWEADPRSFQEAVDTGDDPNVVQDTRLLRVPLPGMGPGSVVEQEVTVREKVTLGGRARTVQVPVAARVPAVHTRMRVEAPVGTGLTYRGPELPVTTRVEGRREVVEVDLSAGERLTTEPGMPDALRLTRTARVGTAATWEQVASAYHGVIAPLLDAKGLEPHVARVREGSDDAARVAIATAIARDEVRYTSIAFGMGRVVPRRPADSHGSSFGDCKDKALLLATLLGQVGISAELALLATRDGPTLDPELPSLDQFDHAIVYLPDLDLWIDATSTWSPAGQLPEMDQARPALRIRPSGGALVRTPEQPTTYQVVTEVRVDDIGLAKVTETSTGEGWVASRMMAQLGDGTEANLAERMRNYMGQRYGAAGVRAELSGRDEPARLRLVAETATLLFADTRGARARVHMDGITEQLEPAHLGDARDHPYDGLPGVHEVIYRIAMPEPLTLEARPSDLALSFGDATLSRRVTREGADDVVQVRLDLGDGDFDPDQLEALAEALGDLDDPLDLHWLPPDEGGLFTQIATRQALGDPTPRDRLAAAERLHQLGMDRDAARLSAEAAAAWDHPFVAARAGMYAEGPEAARWFGKAAEQQITWASMQLRHLDDPTARDALFADLNGRGELTRVAEHEVLEDWVREGRWADLAAHDGGPDLWRTAARVLLGEARPTMEVAQELNRLGRPEGLDLLATLPNLPAGMKQLQNTPVDPTSQRPLHIAARANGAAVAGDLAGTAGVFGEEAEAFVAAMSTLQLGTAPPDAARRLGEAMVLGADVRKEGEEMWLSLDGRALFRVFRGEGGGWQVRQGYGPATGRRLEALLAAGDLPGALTLANWAVPNPEPWSTEGEVWGVAGLALIGTDRAHALELLSRSGQAWAPFQAADACDHEPVCVLDVTEVFPIPELAPVRVQALARSGDWRAARKLAKTLPGAAQDAGLALAMQARGDFAGIEKLMERGRIDKQVWTNNAAWGYALQGRAAQALPLAERSVKLTRTPSNLHTLACVYIGLGRFDEAAQLLAEAEDRDDEPLSAWGWVRARLAEELGLDPAPYRAILDPVVDADTLKLTL